MANNFFKIPLKLKKLISALITDKKIDPLRKETRSPITAWCRVLPDFLIIGAKRSGTTSLWNYLSQHPEIIPAHSNTPKGKEIDFFNVLYDYGSLLYRSYFPTWFEKLKANFIRNEELLPFEATPDYLCTYQVPPRAKEIIPNVKLIVLLRNPVNRAYSEYQQYKLHSEVPEFSKIIHQQKKIINQYTKQNKNIKNLSPYFCRSKKNSLLTRGLYYYHLRRWLNFFPEKQFLIIKSKKFFQRTGQIIKKILNFLDLQQSSLQTDKKYNNIKYSPMNKNNKQELKEFYAPHNQRLYKLLDRNFQWKNEV